MYLALSWHEEFKNRNMKQWHVVGSQFTTQFLNDIMKSIPCYNNTVCMSLALYNMLQVHEKNWNFQLE